MSPEIICIIAIVKNGLNSNFVTIIPEDVHGEHVFNCAYISKHFQAKKKVAISYCIFVLLLLGTRIAFFVTLLEKCKGWYDIFWFVNDVLNVISYTSFCYYLFLQRKALEKEGHVYFEYIRGNFENLAGPKKSRDLFQELQTTSTGSYPLDLDDSFLLILWVNCCVYVEL